MKRSLLAGLGLLALAAAIPAQAAGAPRLKRRKWTPVNAASVVSNRLAVKIVVAGDIGPMHPDEGRYGQDYEWNAPPKSLFDARNLGHSVTGSIYRSCLVWRFRDRRESTSLRRLPA